MTILITGAAGYIASHVTHYLKEQGLTDIVGFDNLKVGLKENAQCELIEGDIRDLDKLNQVFDKYDIDTVMHFAALTSVPESAKYKDEYFDVNTIGTENLLSAMLKHDCKRLIFSSTASVYKQSNEPVTEIDPLQPLNNYALTKLYAERLIKKCDWVDSVIFRYFNVIGYADWYNRATEYDKTNIVPALLKCTQSGNVFRVFGNSYPTKRKTVTDRTCVRDYIDVRDLATAHILAYSYLQSHQNTQQLFNLGTTTGSSVLEFLDAFEKANNIKVPYAIESERMGDPASVVANNRKAKEILNWQPAFSLEQSLKVL